MLQYYREKIKTEMEGRSYVAPPPSQANRANSMQRNRSFSNGSANGSSGAKKDNWDDWGSSDMKVSLVSPKIVSPS